MPLWVCSGCSTRYAPGLEACPHCGSGERVEEGGGGSRLPSRDVACGNDACPAFAVVRRVYLRQPVPGVVEMPYRLHCARCWHAMPALVGSMEEESVPKVTRHGGASNAAADGPPPAVLPKREHPGTGVPMEGIEVPADGTWSPEITGDGTGEALPPIESENVPVEVGDLGPLTDEEAEQVERIGAAHKGEEQRVVVLREEESSPGSSSETSAGKPPSSGETTNPVRPKRARTTANRSKQARTANSTASSTDGSGEADTL